MKLNNYARLFERLVKKGTNPIVSATLLLQTFTELKREGINIDKVSEKEIEELLLLEKKGKINKNNLKNLIKNLSLGKTISQSVKEQELGAINNNEVEKIIEKLVKENITLVKSKKMGSIGPLMGDLKKIKELDKADGKLLSDLLRKKIMEVIK
jgi:glutamyl-tRNA(Gln) amidotransferase subunit E